MFYVVAGAIVRVGEDLLHDAVVSHLLDVDEATVGLLHIALLVVLHLMPMGKSWLYNVLLFLFTNYVKSKVEQVYFGWCYVLEDFISC